MHGFCGSGVSRLSGLDRSEVLHRCTQTCTVLPQHKAIFDQMDVATRLQKLNRAWGILGCLRTETDGFRLMSLGSQAKSTREERTKRSVAMALDPFEELQRALALLGLERELEKRLDQQPAHAVPSACSQ